MSGFVAHNLSGYNENHKGGFHERAQIYYRRIGKCNLNEFIQTGVPKMVIPIAVLIAFFHVFVVPARACGLVRSIYLHVSGTLRESVVINLKSFGGI